MEWKKSNPGKWKECPTKNSDQCREIECNTCFKRKDILLNPWCLHNICFKQILCTWKQAHAGSQTNGFAPYNLEWVYHIFAHSCKLYMTSAHFWPQTSFTLFSFKCHIASRCDLWIIACWKIEIPRNEKKRKRYRDGYRLQNISLCSLGAK